MSSEEFEDLLATVRRDINCLTDESRVTRRRALDKLKRKAESLIEDANEGNKKLLLNLFCGPMHEPLLKSMDDSIEKHREIATTLVKDIVEALAGSEGDVQFLEMIVPHILGRLGQTKLVEPSEELRLETCSLLKLLVKLFPSQAVKRLDDIAVILCKCSLDLFPELKREACACTKLLCAAMIAVASPCPGVLIFFTVVFWIHRTGTQ